MKRLLVLSNPTIDYIVYKGYGEVRAGGPGLYCGLYAGLYGYEPLVYGLLSPRDYSFIMSEYSKANVKLECDFASSTQKFMLIYCRGGSRVELSLSDCFATKPLHRIEQLTRFSEVVIWSPTIAYEGVELELPQRAYSDQVVSVDLQGVARRPKYLPRVLKRLWRVEADYVHASISEVERLFGQRVDRIADILLCREVLISNGDRELVIVESGSRVWGAKPPIRVRGESTGAGDVLLSVYSILRREYSLERAVRNAVANASLHVKSLNNPGYRFGLREVEEYAGMISIYRL